MIIAFNAEAFRAMFAPAYQDSTVYSDPILQTYWDQATAYVSDRTGGCSIYGLKPKQQELALNLMTAHLIYLNNIAATGNNTGVVTGATIDKVSVQMLPPPNSNQWQFWLNQSPYGQRLLALFTVASSGGFYFGGYPTVYGLRR